MKDSTQRTELNWECLQGLPGKLCQHPFCKPIVSQTLMKNPQAYHESAVQLARELFPILFSLYDESKPDRDKFDMKVSTIERHLNGLMAPVEAAANHDISQHETIESTVRAMAHRIIDLEGYMRQNAQ